MEVDSRQASYVEPAKKKLIRWSKENNCPIFLMAGVPGGGKLYWMYIFYKTDEQLKKYEENGMIDRTKERFIYELRLLGYFTEFPNDIRIEFDSDENVKKHFKGNYFFRLLG